MNNSHSECVWITGASSGIGEALAENLYARGCSLVLTARNEMKLQALKETLLTSGLKNKSQTIAVLAMDVTDDAGVEKIQVQLESLAPNLTTIYLCAGLCEYLDFQNIDWQMIKRVFNVNFIGSVNCVASALPLLKRNAQLSAKPCHIVGLSSQAMLMPFTRAEAYGSSKAALHYFLLSLGMDLKRYNIDVTSVLPGFVETPMTQQNNFPMPYIMSPAEAAERICNGVAKRVQVFAFPKRLYFLLKFFSLCPGLWYRKMSPNTKGVK